eukprot:Nk52_evm16s1129 gene=Nk52_evmTU16s1129
MASDYELCASQISYYLRNGFFNTAATVSGEYVRKFNNDPAMQFWKTFGKVKGGNIPEAMRDYSSLAQKLDVGVASSLALIYCHEQSRLVDKEAVDMLREKLRSLETNAPERDILISAQFLLYTGDVDNAKVYCDRLLKTSPNSSEGLSLRGWIDMMSGRDSYKKKAIKWFEDSCNSSGQKDIDGLLGKAKYLEVQRKDFQQAAEILSSIIVLTNSTFVPALIEKALLNLSKGDWEQTSEAAQRALSIDPYSIQAHQLQILQVLAREGSYTRASEGLNSLLQIVERTEPKNAEVFFKISQCFARLSGRNTAVLRATLAFAEKAYGIQQENAEYVCEIAYQKLMMDKLDDASRLYKKAMNLDSAMVAPVHGVIKCQIFNNDLDDAEQQLEFLNEIQVSIGMSPELSYLTSLLAWKKSKDSARSLSLIQQASELHFSSLKKIPLGYDFYTALNPDFVIECVKHYFLFLPSEKVTEGEPIPAQLKTASALLEKLIAVCPGSLKALYLLSRLKYLASDITAAHSCLKRCLENDKSLSEGHLLMAEIMMSEGNYDGANEALGTALASNFEIKNSPTYHLVSGKILKNTGKYEDALATMKTALSLQKKRGSSGSGLGDKAAIYLELVDIHRILDHYHEAVSVMQQALQEFSGTAEEVRISIANADLYLSKNDVENALSLLDAITPDKPYYINAKAKAADVYLKYRKDTRMYAKCYRDLVDTFPSANTYILLGDAYMSISEPEMAISTYEAALKQNPEEGSLATKLGQALVQIHDYSRAISYYEGALESAKSEGKGMQTAIQCDLAELYIKLKRYSDAEACIKKSVEELRGNKLESLIAVVKLLFLLASMYKKQGELTAASDAYTQCRELQNRVIAKASLEKPDLVKSQKYLGADIMYMLGQLYEMAMIRDTDKAISFYQEALQHLPTHWKSMIALAKVYLDKHDLSLCEQQCEQLLSINKESDEATLIIADCLFKKNEYESAIHYFKQLLERKSNNYEALVKFMELSWRAGHMEQVESFLKEAEKACPRAAIEPGLNYCRGLQARYVNKPNQAIKYFNIARKDAEWGDRAIVKMIELCLNPDKSTLGSEALEGGSSGSEEQSKGETEMFAVKTAEKLVKELKMRTKSTETEILECKILMASKAKENVEKALSKFMEILSSERESVPALLGMANAYIILKQVPRARNQLKRLAKMDWTGADAEDLEKSWLILADVYIQSGKFDLAQELLKKCLQYNKSCGKASELMGFIMEKEQAYKDAADHYKDAWNYDQQTNTTVGFRLAFNYLKAKRYTDAIDVCHLILQQDPNYPKVQKDILEKARSSLRV